MIGTLAGFHAIAFSATVGQLLGRACEVANGSPNPVGMLRNYSVPLRFGDIATVPN
jgi:hypothetical protein